MKLSYDWLKDFIDLQDTNISDLADKLTMHAFEVEDIEATREAIDAKVVLGKIEKIDPHPNADKLQVTQTNVGDQVLQIVCGASNIQVGQLVPVALKGAQVTDRKTGDKFLIKDSKIRAVESFGMLCSAEELGFDKTKIEEILAKQGDGIYILADSNKALGTSIEEVLALKSDYVLEVGARSNRGDALSVCGQAREIAAILEKQLIKAKDKDFSAHKNLTTIKPAIESDCDVFFTLAIKNIQIKESPQWLKDRIEAMGVNSINNIVDISNYVLLERGQPMHFYDMNKLQGDTLTVRKANSSEKIVTLEEKEHQLDETNLVIADAQGPVSLAGVMGGLNSAINDATTDVLIEVAVFSPSVVRKSSRSAGVESESKRRYERGVDKAQAKSALLKAVELILDLASTADTKVGEILMAGSDTVAMQVISLDEKQVEKLLGIKIDKKQIIDILARLEIQLLKESGSSLEFSIPSFRQNDITREIDLIEEIGRLYGFNNIPTQRPAQSIFVSKDSVSQYVQTCQNIRDVFKAYGYSEVRLSSLIGDSVASLDQRSIDTISKQVLKPIAMDNPLSIEHSSLRRSLIPGLIQAASRNYSYQKNKDIKLFEIGKIYGYSKDSVSSCDDCLEVNKISGIFVQNEKKWTNKKEACLAENFYILKSVIENLYSDADFFSIDQEQQQHNLLHPGISARVKYQGKEIGLIAKLHPNIQKEWDLPDETYVFELEFPKAKKIKFKAISNTPSILRDITVDSKLDLETTSIINLIKKNTNKTLKEIKVSALFVREQGNLDLENNKSTTLTLTWQDDTQTLLGEDIDANIEQLKGLLEKELKVTFRA